MCGIIGYVGEKNCAPLLIAGLKNLEYRGYDSAGIVVLNGDSKFKVRKAVGRVAGLERQINFSTFDGSTGIAHTRWATHGKPSIPNCHPHFDPTGTIGIVHNGIIENFAEIREGLAAEGARFASETDTELIAHLIAKKHSSSSSSSSDISLEAAVRATLPALQGTYGLGVISSREPGKIVAARKQSPLIIGLGNGENFIASGIPAFLEHTRQALVLDEGEMAVLTKDKVSILDIRTGRKISRKPWTVDWTPEQAKLGGYPHYMLKEIEEQPETIPKVAAQDERIFRSVAGELKKAERVIMLACGTSRHAALIGRYLLMKQAGLYCEVMLASEFRHFADSLGRGTVVLAISQSGETADVMESVRAARKSGAKIYSIANVLGSTLTRESDGTIYMHAGPEIGVAATKSFSATVIVFMLLSLALTGKYSQAKRKVAEAASLVKETIEGNREAIKSLAGRYKRANAVYFIGRGINFASALEGALKLKEIAYIHAEGMPAGELKHGSIALVERGVPIVSLNPSDDTYDETISNTMEVKARDGAIIGISDRPNRIYDNHIRLPAGADPLLYPLLSVIPLQMLAYYAGVARGNDVDKPRNLAKSVTVK